MHRKSAYLLFLAVLGLLVIGSVMLFSTSAFARDSHGDVYYFHQRHAIWLGVGLVFCSSAALIDYHFWHGPGGSGSASRSSRWPLLFPARQRTAPVAGSCSTAGCAQPSEFAKLAAVFFLAWWFSRYEKESGQIWHGFVPPAGDGRAARRAHHGRSRSRHDRAHRRDHFYRDVRRRHEPRPARRALVRRSRRDSFRRHAHAGAHGAADRLPAPGAVQTGRRLAADAGADRLGQRRHRAGSASGNGRQKMLYLPYAHTDFIFPIDRRRTRVAFQPARRFSFRRHHRLRN